MVSSVSCDPPRSSLQKDSASLSVALPKALTPDVRRSIFDIMSQMKKGEGKHDDEEEKKTMPKHEEEEDEGDSGDSSDDSSDDSDSESEGETEESEQQGKAKEGTTLNQVVVSELKSPDSGQPIAGSESDTSSDNEPAVVSHGAPGKSMRRRILARVRSSCCLCGYIDVAGAEEKKEGDSEDARELTLTGHFDYAWHNQPHRCFLILLISALEVQEEYSRPVLDVGTGEERLRIALQLNHMMKVTSPVAFHVFLQPRSTFAA